jgi:biotin synthase-like enzyme
LLFPDKSIIREAKEMENKGSRMTSLYQASHRIPQELMKAALETAFLIQDKTQYAEALSRLAEIDGVYFTEALEAADSLIHRQLA